MPGVAAKASEVREESSTYSHMENPLQVDSSSAVAMDIDDGSDLTSLEDENEQADVVQVTRNLDETGSNESSLTAESSEEERNGTAGPSSNGVSQPLLPTQMSPSRIGSAIARPTPPTRLKTYGGRKSGSRAGVKVSPKPKPPMSPMLFDTSSSSPTPASAQKRRVSTSAPQQPSSPTKSTKRRKRGKINDEPVLRKKPGPKPKSKVTTIGSSPLPETAPISKQKGKGRQVAHREAPTSSPGSIGQKLYNPSLSAKDTWSLELLEKLVWVRLDRRNNVVDDEDLENFWWPAKVEVYPSGQGGLQVRVFSPPTIPADSTFNTIQVERPSAFNIISYPTRNFTADNFYSLASSSSLSRPYGFDKIKSRWEAAYKEIKTEDTVAHDGFPSSIAGLFPHSVGGDSELGDDSISRDSPRRTLTALPTKTVEEEPWSPPAADNNVSVPGEHVLSTLKSKKFRGKYYPAKVVGYVQPDSPTTPPLYTVHFMDNYRENVTRDMFYIYEEDEFGTCKLGVYISYESFHEVDGEDDLDDEFLANIGNYIHFPERQLPAPTPDVFCALPMLEQTAYIVPILSKIIKNNYKPAEERISAFMQGGRKRTNMLKDAPQKGTLTRRELRELAEIIKRFTEEFDSFTVKTKDDMSITENETPLPSLGQTGTQQVSTVTPGEPSNEQQYLTHLTKMDESTPLPPPSLPPSSTAEASIASTPKADSDGDPRPIVPASANGQQTFLDDPHQRAPQNCVYNTTYAQQLSGSTVESSATFSFFDLSGPEKIQFATDVLLREAIVQILLWRTGKRTTTDTLTDKKENELRDIGLNLASTIDIAHTVNDLREKKVKSQQLAKVASSSQVSVKGTRSRPKNV